MNKKTSKKIPALLFSAPASGQGKTTIVSAYIKLWTRRGYKIAAFKTGPDFLDPFWHNAASGGYSQNIDLWINGEKDINKRLYNAAENADIIIIEGAMGLHDGEPSAADIARKYKIPVVLIAQVGKMAQSIGALAYGMRHWGEKERGKERKEEDKLPWAGVITNQVASPSHAILLKKAIEKEDILLGNIPKDNAFIMPERHLGLISATEFNNSEIQEKLNKAADIIEKTPLGQMNINQLTEKYGVTFTSENENEIKNNHPLKNKTIAITKDKAFAFIYPANIELLKEMGAEIKYFSPLAGDELPECDSIWITGGYPELHLDKISQNTKLKNQIQNHAKAGKPIYAECGGMMTIFETITTKDNQEYKMWEILKGKTIMQTRLAGLGMQQLIYNLEDNKENTKQLIKQLRGHTFHYSILQTPLEPKLKTKPSEGSARKEGENIYIEGIKNNIVASYFHAYFPSYPEIIAKIFTGKLYE